MFLANARATQLLKKIDPNAKMGIMCSFSALATYAYDCDPENVFGSLQFKRNSWFSPMSCAEGIIQLIFTGHGRKKTVHQ